MTFVILDSLPGSSAAQDSALPQTPDARYNFLANSILSSLGENGGISLVVADSSVRSSSLRRTLEQVHGDLTVFEVPCRNAIATAGIIPSMPHFVSGASSAVRRLAGPGARAMTIETRHAPMLFICDGADGLEDEQLETMYRLSRGGHGPLGVVLLAKPEFLLRMQNSHLNHIKAGLTACFWSQRSSYGGVCAADRQDQVEGFMALNPAQLPSPLLEQLQNERTVANDPSPSSVRTAGARARKSGVSPSRRYGQGALTAGFSIGCLVVVAASAYVATSMSSQPQTAAVSAAPPLSRPPSTSLASRAPAGAGAVSATRAEAPPAAPAPKQAAKDTAAATAIPSASAPEKSTPSVAAAAEPPKHQEDTASLSPAPPTEKTAPATSASVGPAPKPGAPVPETKLSDADRALFAQRGNELLAAGDIASARLFFERAANAGDAGSALGMAKTFDPDELAKAGVRGVKGDLAKADYWYQRARSLAGDRNFGN